MAITFVQEWRYEKGSPVAIGYESGVSYFNGAGYSSGYYVAVYKYYTDRDIKAPSITLRSISDNTTSSKYLGAYFVSCTEGEQPSSTLTANSDALSGKYQTRLRFSFNCTGMTGSWTSGTGNKSTGTCESTVVIPKGYFFIYIGTATGSAGNNWSTFAANSNTVSGWPPVVSGTEVTYTISYNANGGTGSTSSQTVVGGNSVNLRSNGFTPPTAAVHTLTLNGNGGKNGTPSFQRNYFSSWRTGKTSGTTYAEGASFKPTGNTTLYARWGTYYIWGSTTRDSVKTDGYTITYDANGGTCSISSVTVEDITQYDFQGWGTSASATSATYNSTSAYGQTDNYTAYAVWKSSTTKGSTTLPTPTNKTTSTLKITFDYQGGSGSSDSANSTKTITKAFKGWATSSTATTGSTGSYTPDKSRPLYAIWGTSTTKYSAINLPTPTKTGYKFMGWAVSTSATEGTFDSYTPTSDSITTLYAIWEANGNIRIYVNSTDKYKMAMVYVYAPTSTSDTKPWKLVIPYLYTSGTQPWKIIAG